MKVVVVEDHEMFSQMLRGALSTIQGVSVVATARSVHDGVKACEEYQPECLILDLGLPDGDGVTVAREAIKKNPKIRIIVLSGHTSTLMCPSGLESNFHAIINKRSSFSLLEKKLLDLLNGDAKGETPVSPAPSSREELLTRREARIYELLGSGRSNKQIAEVLRIRENTIKTHRRNIASKLGIHGPELLIHAHDYQKKFQNRPNDLSP